MKKYRIRLSILLNVTLEAQTVVHAKLMCSTWFSCMQSKWNFHKLQFEDSANSFGSSELFFRKLSTGSHLPTKLLTLCDRITSMLIRLSLCAEASIVWHVAHIKNVVISGLDILLSVAVSVSVRPAALLL